LTIPYNPQQNGVVAWKNQSIIGAIKTMIHDQGLPMFLWAETCNAAVYIKNQCPHKILEDKTPVEAFIDVKPKVSNFHIFGCLVYIHVTIEKRTKLEPSSKKGLFVCYSETSKAYRIYIPKQRKTIVSKDVKLEEDFASRKSREPTPVVEDEEQEAPKVELGSPVISRVV
jgi:hypothetical protein